MSDIKEVLNYIQDQDEYVDFLGNVLENGTPGLNEKEIDRLSLGNADDQKELEDKAIANPEETHIWACAERVREDIRKALVHMESMENMLLSMVNSGAVNRSCTLGSIISYSRELRARLDTEKD